MAEARVATVERGLKALPPDVLASLTGSRQRGNDVRPRLNTNACGQVDSCQEQNVTVSTKLSLLPAPNVAKLKVGDTLLHPCSFLVATLASYLAAGLRPARLCLPTVTYGMYKFVHYVGFFYRLEQLIGLNRCVVMSMREQVRNEGVFFSFFFFSSSSTRTRTQTRTKTLTHLQRVSLLVWLARHPSRSTASRRARAPAAWRRTLASATWPSIPAGTIPAAARTAPTRRREKRPRLWTDTEMQSVIVTTYLLWYAIAGNLLYKAYYTCTDVRMDAWMFTLCIEEWVPVHILQRRGLTWHLKLLGHLPQLVPSPAGVVPVVLLPKFLEHQSVAVLPALQSGRLVRQLEVVVLEPVHRGRRMRVDLRQDIVVSKYKSCHSVSIRTAVLTSQTNSTLFPVLAWTKTSPTLTSGG